jgi:hypothetical protein
MVTIAYHTTTPFDVMTDESMDREAGVELPCCQFLLLNFRGQYGDTRPKWRSKVKI